MLRVTTAALLCLIALPAQSSPIPCWKVRGVIVWAGGEIGAEAYARKHGYTDAQIAEARKCLKH